MRVRPPDRSTCSWSTSPTPPAGTAFLQKPFLPEQLAQKVRAVLEGADD